MATSSADAGVADRRASGVCLGFMISSLLRQRLRHRDGCLVGDTLLDRARFALFQGLSELRIRERLQQPSEEALIVALLLVSLLVVGVWIHVARASSPHLVA